VGCAPLERPLAHRGGDGVGQREIERLAALERAGEVLEVGPGLGVLTRALSERAGRVVAVEIDRGMVAALGELLAEREIEHERIDLRTAQLDAARIGALLAKAGVAPRDALRPSEPGAVALIERDASDEEVLAAIAADLSLLMRPIAERGDRAVVARPAERALDLL